MQEEKLAHASLPPWWDDFRDALVLVQEEKIAFLRCSCAFERGNSKDKLPFPHDGMMLFQDALVPIQEGKIAHARFARGWSDVVQHEIILVQDGRLPCASFSPC